MTQEEKLEEAKRLYETANADQKYVLERLFSELKESEDERIRKALIEHFAGSHSSMYPYKGFTKKQILAWLEKQGEQKPTISYDALREGIGHYGITQYQIDNWLKKYVDVEKQELKK